MKKLTLFIAFAFLIQAPVFSQSCLPAGITFSNQAAIDSFQSNNPGCTEIEGDVKIEGSNITNLNGLNVLTAFGGDLWVKSSGNLYNLTGLDSITSISGGLKVEGTVLNNLSGLDQLTTIGGALEIYYHYSLITLAGLEKLTSIGGDLKIGYYPYGGNHYLISIAALSNVTSIGGNVEIIECHVLPNLSGLEGITSIPGDLIIGQDQIGGNAVLNSLSGLDNVTSIGGNMSIEFNDSVTSVTLLNNLTCIGCYV